jgi:transposase
MLARRIQIAKMLLGGDSYEEIMQRLHTSGTTIASVHRWLQGGFSGYVKGIPKLTKELERRMEVGRRTKEAKIPLSNEWLKRKYPLHYLLVNLIDWAALRPPKKLRR